MALLLIDNCTQGVTEGSLNTVYMHMQICTDLLTYLRLQTLHTYLMLPTIQPA